MLIGHRAYSYAQNSRPGRIFSWEWKNIPFHKENPEFEASGGPRKKNLFFEHLWLRLKSLSYN